ncbi:hypothetical protein KPZU09_00670 [Klebsiella pneumoniae]|uniref:Uncharacterized protein n=1 Tax=Klebsiella pneumoniae TaxID=573 RepID=A0A919HK29_KLEPN|nr:hypothetical protein KPZU09_00670 [Klebsiella pneumoniae]
MAADGHERSGRRPVPGAKGALGGGVKDLAISGQTDALRAAFADPALQHRLQQFNLMADRRRADAERLGGLFKTAVAGDGMKARSASGGRRAVSWLSFSHLWLKTMRLCKAILWR